MAHSKTDLWQTPNSIQAWGQALSRKLKEVIHHPFTCIVLVWVFLWLVFYLVTDFI